MGCIQCVFRLIACLLGEVIGSQNIGGSRRKRHRSFLEAAQTWRVFHTLWGHMVPTVLQEQLEHQHVSLICSSIEPISQLPLCCPPSLCLVNSITSMSDFLEQQKANNTVVHTWLKLNPTVVPTDSGTRMCLSNYSCVCRSTVTDRGSSFLMKLSKTIPFHTLPPAVWCVMRENISIKAGSPCPVAQQFLAPPLFIHSLLFPFYSTNRAQFVPCMASSQGGCIPPSVVVFFYCCSSVSITIPPLAAVPSPRCTPSPPALLLPTSHQATCSKAQIHQGGKKEVRIEGVANREVVWTEREQNEWRTNWKGRPRGDGGEWWS